MAGGADGHPLRHRVGHAEETGKQGGEERAGESGDNDRGHGDALDAAAAAGATVTELYDGQGAGYVLKVVASGSQGNIEMMVGVDGDGVVTGVSVVDSSETAGIGTKVTGNEPLASGTGVLDQFIGKSAADGTLSVGSNVEAITGATVSTRGVTTGVNAALAAVGAMG